MSCVHLQQLFQLCQDNDIKISSGDLVHVVCKQCQREEVCPSLLYEEYEATHPEAAGDSVATTIEAVVQQDAAVKQADVKQEVQRDTEVRET